MIIHTVKEGESLYSIANDYQVDLQRLITDNGLRNPNNLVIGQTLVILLTTEIHTVHEVESLFYIGKMYGISINQLYRNNPGLQGKSEIYPGQQLVIRYRPDPIGSTDINGYAYPYIDLQLLRQTLPYLTYLMPFTYEISEDGSLVPPDDVLLIQMAKEYGVAPFMNLSNLREPKGFDSQLAHRILGSRELQDRIIRETLTTMRQKGYSGLDIDFEYVLEEDKYRLADFIQRFRSRLNPAGYEVFAALAAKTSEKEAGLLTAGHDYKALGEAADAVLLMTYEWGYRYGPPMAIAPIGNVRQVLDYAVTQIPPRKIFVGIPNYGYDWPLPYQQGITEARSISNVEAVDLAMEQGVSIQYDNNAQAPYFQYVKDGITHEVWFDDAKSIRAKLELVAEYGLRGAGYWNLMRPFPENWAVLNGLYRVNPPK